MKNNNHDAMRRRSIMSGMGVAALAGVAIGATSTTPAAAQNVPAGFSPRRHALDAWMNEIPGEHRAFIDTSEAAGGTNALRYCANILNAHVEAYAGNDSEMAMIICFRHASTPLGFSDAMWEKYADAFVNFTQLKHAQGAPIRQNPALKGVDDLGARGVKFAICNSATLALSRMLAGSTGGKAEDFHAELQANAIPNSRFVPAGVMAVTRAQEYGYSLLYSA